jgi:predicted nucleic acid-binding protein
MSGTIVIIDTSVFVEILAVPGKSQAIEEIRAELEEWIESDAALLLPMAVIIETGNHIAQVSNGRKRRRAAKDFVERVQEALDGKSPFEPTPSFAVDTLREWLPSFVQRATAGIGMADASLIELWEQQRALNQARRVLIWSLDEDLSSYDTDPPDR